MWRQILYKILRGVHRFIDHHTIGNREFPQRLSLTEHMKIPSKFMKVYANEVTNYLQTFKAFIFLSIITSHPLSTDLMAQISMQSK